MTELSLFQPIILNEVGDKSVLSTHIIIMERVATAISLKNK